MNRNDEHLKKYEQDAREVFEDFQEVFGRPGHQTPAQKRVWNYLDAVRRQMRYDLRHPGIALDPLRAAHIDGQAFIAEHLMERATQPASEQL